jgi:epoxide hydrolase-like protein
MKSSRNVRNYFRMVAMQRRTFSFLSAGIVIVVMISGVAAAQSPTAAPADGKATRPFHINIPKEAVADMLKRVAATRWPEKETVTDASQGVQLATMKKLADYWAKDYDWRKTEAKLNSYPQFVTNIDGVDIHFIHVRSKNPNALPVIITHGWPGSIIEQLKIIGPLTDPVAYGRKAEDSFDVVIPSLPGYGFSGNRLRPAGIPFASRAPGSC